MLWYEVAMKSLFSFQGTISRSQFWLGILAELLVIFLVAILLERLGPIEGLGPGSMAAICVLVFFFGWWWVAFTLHAKRLRDAGLSPWLCLLLFVPLANFVVLLIAGFKTTAVEKTGAPTR